MGRLYCIAITATCGSDLEDSEAWFPDAVDLRLSVHARFNWWKLHTTGQQEGSQQVMVSKAVGCCNAIALSFCQMHFWRELQQVGHASPALQHTHQLHECLKCWRETLDMSRCRHSSPSLLQACGRARSSCAHLQATLQPSLSACSFKNFQTCR